MSIYFLFAEMPGQGPSEKMELRPVAIPPILQKLHLQVPWARTQRVWSTSQGKQLASCSLCNTELMGDSHTLIIHIKTWISKNLNWFLDICVQDLQERPFHLLLIPISHLCPSCDYPRVMTWQFSTYPKHTLNWSGLSDS